jgi:heterodisulfide reductase subunit A
MSQKPRVGVFVCHCGLNIAGVVDVEAVTEYARTLPDVVYAVHNRYTCSDPGQEEIRKAIKEHNLNRVVVAACSPRMHEFTFRRTVSEAGLNPYLFEMANIREHCSWCHPSSPEQATHKAKEIVKVAVAKVRLFGPLTPIEVPVTNKALVVGGGIAGINAALDLAEMGFKVYLVEKKESIGGHMAQLDKTFPTLDCSICIEGPKMVDVSRHPNIEIFTFSDVISVEGFVGNFKVKLRKNPRLIIEKNCTGCGECREVCPIEYPNPWDMNMGVRKAISAPFDQAVPLIYRINKDYCIECYKCVDACGDRQAIDFSREKPEEAKLEAGAIIVTTGYDVYLPEEGNVYGYGKHSNVITSLEFERLILAAGPTGGHVIRASDGKQPKVVALIQCVGSREVDKYPYCSGFCCMYTIKHAVQLKEHYGRDIEVYVFYIDMRTNFKGYEEFYTRAREMGVNFIRGRVSKVLETPEKNLIIRAEDTLLGEPIELDAEMVVLATAAIACPDAGEVSRVLNITRGMDGFFMESHPKLKPIDTPVDGVFLAGACQGPKDIPYSVSQGSGAAARAATILSKKTVKIEPIISVVDPEKCRNTKVKCGICAKKCPYGAIRVEPNKPAEVIAAMCHGCGTCVAECPADAITQMHFTDAQILAQVQAALEDNPEDKIMGFCCNWCSYAGADLAGTSRFEYPTNLRVARVMCSGRVDRDFVLDAFRKGAGMVLIGACHLPYDCHYIDGNAKMKARMDSLAKMLEKLGLTPDRFRVEYISAAEGVKFAEVIRDMAARMKEIGKDRIKAENAKLKPVIDRMLERKSA